MPVLLRPLYQHLTTRSLPTTMTEQVTLTKKQLHQALVSFGRSPRFFIFKGVQIGRLMPEGDNSVADLAELTLEQLVEQAKSEDLASLALSAEQEQGLLHLLVALGEEGECGKLAADDDISVVVPDSFSSVDIPTLDAQLKEQGSDFDSEIADDLPFGSVPLELALRASLAKIVAHVDYPRVQKMTIGDFWDPSWTAAPFEEAMTIEQFAGLDLAVLFKKRMVTDTRIQSILRALRRVIENLNDSSKLALGSGDPPRSPSRQPTKKSSPDRQLGDRLGYIQDSRQDSRQDYHQPIHLPASVAAAAVIDILLGARSSSEVVDAVCGRFSLSECADIVLGQEISKVVYRDLKNIVERAVVLEARELVLALLTAPAARIDHIARVIEGLGRPLTAASLCVAAVVARGLGARPVAPSLFNSAELWALDASFKSDLDPYLQGVIKAQGKGKFRRKDSPKRLNHRRRKGI
jgi:hypothetical protein